MVMNAHELKKKHENSSPFKIPQHIQQGSTIKVSFSLFLSISLLIFLSVIAVENNYVCSHHSVYLNDPPHQQSICYPLQLSTCSICPPFLTILIFLIKSISKREPNG